MMEKPDFEHFGVIDALTGRELSREECEEIWDQMVPLSELMEKSDERPCA